MARFAPVAPAHVVQKLSDFARGDYHLVLAHDVVKDPDTYRRVYNNWGMTVILDNSVIELGGAVDLDMIVEAAKIVQPHSVVLPDVLLDTDATIDACKDAYATWYEPIKAVMEQHRKWGFMYVPQGKTPSDFARAADAFDVAEHINFWGIPRNVVAYHGSRATAIEICHALNGERRQHLLGFSDDIIDDVICARIKGRNIVGIDSAVPLRAATLGLDMSMSLKMPPRGDWWDTVEHVPAMDYNIATFKGWIRP
jgi:hypothetical protein